uniref:EAL domain-containing protein n=1 Tax=Pelomonas sp. KK5 TaxID=1855730 RepID=UPI00097C9EB9
LPATLALNIGAHLSVPIRLGDGRVFGTFCCFSRRPDTSLSERDLVTMRVLAEVMAEHFGRERAGRDATTQLQRRIDRALESGCMRSVYQPIFDLSAGSAVGFEALTRFDCEPPRTPDLWFTEAAQVQRGVELELHAIKLALAGIATVPAGLYLTLNASPGTILDGRLARMLCGYPLDRIVLEVTEHDEVQHYAEIARAVDPLRDAGLRVAVDDAGAGFACFRHILNLAPDIIKLDNSITRHIDTDTSRQALAAALARFAETTRGKLVAEGVETNGELAMLQHIGIEFAQGYSLCRPGPLRVTLDLADQAAARLRRSPAFAAVH